MDQDYVYLHSEMNTPPPIRPPSPERLSTLEVKPEDIFKRAETHPMDDLFPKEVLDYVQQIRYQRQLAEASSVYAQAIMQLQEEQRPKSRKEKALERIRRKLAEKRGQDFHHD